MSEWDRREVCPDGACIGVIGDDGLCKVCGRAAPNWGNERARGLVDPDDDDAEEEEDDDEGDEGADEGAGESAGESDDALDAAEDAATNEEGSDAEWEHRELCSNGACVGVIGDKGVCTVCGSPRA